MAHYLSYSGASTVALPEALSDRERRRALDGQAAEDGTGPDRLDVVLRTLARQGVSAWLDVPLTGRLPGLPAPDSPEALARGLTRIDRKGRPDGPTPAYHPLNPDVAAAVQRRLTEAVTKHKTNAKLAGLLVRLGSGPTLLGAPDTGLDDATFARFAREAFDRDSAQALPGLDGGHDDPGRFAARSRFLAGSGRVPWLTWRSERIAAYYHDLADAARQMQPGLALAVATPALGDGPAGAEARRADLAGLDPSQAWRAVGLDLDVWPAGEVAPIVLREVTLGPDDLARDLANSPELDAKVAARPARGMLVDVDAPAPEVAAAGRPRRATELFLTAQPVDTGPLGDEPLGHGMAAIDPRWMLLAAASMAGREERLRRYSQTIRGLPAEHSAADRPAPAFGVSVRSVRSGGQTYLTLSNDTPYPILVDTLIAGAPTARVFDLSRAQTLKPEADATGRHLVLELLPYGTWSVRVATLDVKVASVTPWPSDAVLTSMQTRYDELAAQLSRLTRGVENKEAASTVGPPNPGFEPIGPRLVQMNMNAPAPDPAEATMPKGWQLSGGMGATLAIDPVSPHSGEGSLRVDSPTAPGAVVCDDFALGVQPVLLVRTWLRADRPDAKVRLWIEGESAGTAYRRLSELAVPQSWTERAVRVSDVPPAGLDTARLRFELLTAGTLWIDDVNVSGETLTEPERRNARNALLAALQAYKEKRYADFARLAGSRWTRHPVVIGAGQAELTRTGDASALPQGRRLR